MGIVVGSTPYSGAGHVPAFNDIKYLVSSTNSGQDNFKYVMDIYINGSGTRTHRETVPPHPTYGTGNFNPARIVESFVSGNFDLDLTKVTQAVDGAISMTVKFGEEYGLNSSGTTVYPDQAEETIAVFNAVFDYEDFCDYAEGKYRSENSDSEFLSNAPNNQKIYQDDNAFVYAINRTSGDIYYFEVTTKDSSLNPLGVYRIDNDYQANVSNDDRMVRMAAGWNLNDIDQSDITITGGTYAAFPIMYSSVAFYSIKCIKFDGTTTIASRDYTIDTNCDRFTKHKFHFLNKLGGYDSYVFSKANTFNTGITRSNYKKNLGLQSDASTFTYSQGQRAISQFNTDIEDTLTCKTDWLSSGDVAWLEELVTSPDVYVERNGNAVPVVITNSNFIRQNGEGQKLFTLTITYKFSYKRYRQRL